MIAHIQALASFEAVLRTQGLIAGLEFLNARVPHRVTAVYLISGHHMKNVAVFDKNGHTESLSLAQVPIADSFCQYVLADRPFVTNDSAHDTRLDGNPHQGAVACYVGLPLTRTGNDLFGTFCHLDFVMRDIDDDEFEFLQHAVRAIPRFMPHA